MSISVTAFAAHLRAGDRSPATVEKYVREVRRFALWLGDRPLSLPAAQAYRAQLMERRAPAGVNGAVAALNAFFACSGREGVSAF